MRRHRPARRVVATATLVATALAVTVVLTLGNSSGPAGAQDGPTTVPPLRPPTTLGADAGTIQGSDCGPGNIVRPPYCGEEPASRDDPGGWLQVSLFFVVCAVIIGIGGFVWWRSRVIRSERRAAGLDPEDVARRAGQGMRPGETADPTVG